MKTNLKLRAFMEPNPTVVAAAYDEESLAYRSVDPKASDAFKPGAALRKDDF